MTKRILILVHLLLLHCCIHAQYNLKENSFWAFGGNYAIDFSGGTPVAANTPLASLGGSAAVCNASGQLLFYTQGDTIWNKNNQVMPNGAGLITPYTSNANGTQSDQGQLIVPVIGNPQQYYVFSMQTVGDFYFNGDPQACRLYYSVVDMSLNNGLGDVVSGQKTIPVDSALTGNKMIAVPGNDCNIWLITHTITGNTFKVYEITENGISTTPVVSSGGNLIGGIAYTEGKLRISPNRQKLFVASAFGTTFDEVGAELFDFNPADGTISNPVLLDTASINFSGCFSPDNSKLYVIGAEHSFTYITLYQFDLSLPTTADIIASKTYLDSANVFNYVRDVRLAPDGKVYASLNDPGDTLSRVNFPNLAGTACGYEKKAIGIPVIGFLGNGNLPNEYVKPVQDTVMTSLDTVLTTAGTLTLTASAGYDAYTWSNGATGGSITVNAPGTYWVTYQSYCLYETDTFIVAVNPEGIFDVHKDNQLLVYPNPAQDYVTIQAATGNTLSGTIHITDMTGRRIAEQPSNTAAVTINTSSFAPGVYMISFINRDGNTFKQPLVISKK